MGKLDGKVAVVTGASSGLGRQFAIRLAHEGANVAICARTEPKLAETKALCEEAGADVLALRCDVGVYDELKTFVDGIAEHFGTIDVLVNNAATVSPQRPFLECTLDDLDTDMRTFYCATWHMMKLCFPYMKDRGGSIINLGSTGGVLGLANYAIYASVKEATRALTRVVAKEWGQYGIRVNDLLPSAMTDNLAEYAKYMIPAVRELVERDMRDGNVFRRYGDPYADIAPVVVFLASDDSKWMTGQTLHVEGGSWMNA